MYHNGPEESTPQRNRTETAMLSRTYFKWPESPCFDPMHDLLEGVIPMIIKNIFQEAVKSGKLSIDELNHRITKFDYGQVESPVKPLGNFTILNLKSKGHTLSQSASQTWLLLRCFPFIFYDLFDSINYSKELISYLLEICFISFSNNLTLNLINDLKKAVELFHEVFLKRFSATSAINKIHHISHYYKLCIENGPVANNSCFMYEMKFKESKSQVATCYNRINLTFSMSNRLAVKQANSIINHNYIVDKPIILKSSLVKKDLIDTALVLFDYPNMDLV